MSLTRRHMLGLLAGVTATPLAAQRTLFGRKLRAAAPPAHPALLIGSDTEKAGSGGVYLARFDPANGTVTNPQLALPGVRASWMALNPVHERRIVYLTDERDGPGAALVTCMLEAGSPAIAPALHLVGRVSSGGAGPTYVTVDATGSKVFCANYTGGSVSSFQVQADGRLSEPIQVTHLRDGATYGEHGPNRERQEAPHPHSAVVSPTDRFLVVNDLGLDALITWSIEPASGRLEQPHITRTRPGAGPRHLAFHPNGRWVYVADELTSEIDQYLWNTVHGRGAMPDQALLTSTGRTFSTLAPGYQGKNTAAEILVGPDGRFLYVSNRGEDTVAVFGIDPQSGALKPVQRIACGGHTPRQMSFDATGRWLLVPNLASSNLAIFALNAGTGQLSGPVHTVEVPSPMFAMAV